ncbi:MAG: GAF domain-containing protein [Candidatus Rokubacteria bacterium]|nr:GAF domain-containing protein [Candidatus Rokubacteria bacterium]
MAPGPDQVSIGLVGAGKGGSALLDLVIEWPGAKVAVVVDPRPDAPALCRARSLGIPTATHHLEVFAYPVDLVLEVTGQPAVLDDLLRAKPPNVQVIGAAGLRFFWDLLQDRVEVSRQLQAQLDLALVLASTLDLKQQIALVARKVAQACGVDRCTFYVWDDPIGLVIPVTSQSATGQPNERMWNAFTDQGQLKLVQVPFLYEVIERRTPIEIEDAASNPLQPAGWANLFHTKSTLVVPLFRKDRVVGACTLDYCREPHRFSTDQTALAVALSGQIALALENTQLYQDITDKTSQLTSLLESTKRTTAIKDSSQLLPWIAEEAARVLKAEGAGIRILEGNELVLVAHYGYSREGLWERVALGQSASGWVVQNNQPLAISDMERDPRVVSRHRDVFRREGFRSLLAVPMRIAEQVIGALYIVAKSPRRFSANEIEGLSGFADQAALALENARLYEESERRRNAAERLSEVGRLLSQSLDPEEVGQRVVDSLRTLFKAETASLFRLEAGSGDLVTVAVSGDVGPTPGGHLVLPKDTGAAGLAVLERQPVMTANVLTDPRITLAPADQARIEQAAYRAVLAVPLVVKDTVIGALGIGNREGRVFDSEEVWLAQAFADQAAIALENSRLYGELRAALEQVEASQERIVRTERLRALGEMAAGVAHDFNNLLAVILGRTDLLLTRVKDPEVARGLKDVRTAALDGAQTVRRIQEFTRTRRTRPFGRVDLRELVQEAVELTRPRWEDEAQSRGVPYEVRVEGEPVSPVAGIAEELREVFTNVLINALEAMPGGGRLVFRVRSEASDVVVTAEDTGCGMSEETRRRVFEPFFTTKGPRGTGLGLAAAWGIVTRHGGMIDLESTLGVGSTFTVRLPTAGEVVSEESPAVVAPPARTARVLVIEDEPAVRVVVKEILTDAGYTVIEAADGAEGLARGEAEAVDLVLSDLSMPGMSGWEVAAACRERFPNVPVGFITGWGDQLDPEQLERHRIRFVLAKPFAAEEVLNRVARALAE